jgi:tripartite-type tricarboxylate transporter receptor subunit TctC
VNPATDWTGARLASPKNGRLGRRIRAWCLLAIFATTSGVIATEATAQPYPTRPIRLVVGFAAGSATDQVARLLAEPLGEVLRQPVVVENRAGAASTLATGLVARAEPDGYTLTLGTNSALATAPAGLIRDVGYDPLRDFTPLGRVATVSFMLVGNRDLPPKNLRDLVRYLQANPKGSGCASGNTNGVVFCEIFKRRLGSDIVSVPYKSTPSAVTDVIGGQVPVMFVDVPTGAPRVRDGQLHAFAVTSERRSPVVPDIPTMTEAGLDGIPPNSGWWALFGPAGIPAPVAEQLTGALDSVLSRPEVRQRMLAIGVEPSPASPDELRVFMKQQLEDWRKFLTEFKLAVEG